jgi:hypothetical protein
LCLIVAQPFGGAIQKGNAGSSDAGHVPVWIVGG